MLALILGLISFVLAVGLAVVIHSFTSFDLTSFSLFFIVPVGSIAIGAIACLGYYGGLVLSNKKIKSWLFVIGLMIPVLAYVATQYGYYATAYLDDNMNLNYKMEGYHISEYSLDENSDPFNFFSYTKYEVESRVISFSRRARNIAEIEGNAVVNWIFFFIDGLGSMIGCVFALGIAVKNSKYCDNCKRYMKNKEVFNFPTIDVDKTIKFQEIGKLTRDEIKELLPVSNVGNEERYDVYLHWCEMCSNGHLEMQYMHKNSKGNLTEDSSKSKTLDIPADTVKLLLELFPN